MVERGPTQAWAPRTSTEDAQLKVKGREDWKRTVTPTSSDANATFATSLREAAAGDYLPLNPGEPFADVRVQFSGSIAGPCAFWLEANGTVGSMNVLDKVPSEPYVWHKVPEGQHRVQLVLWTPAGMDAFLRPSKPEDLSSFDSRGSATVDFRVKRFEDFIPSYEWKAVERWHQLPPGLEIVGDFSSCRAKIPDCWPWRVQVQGQGEPLEVLVRRESTMAELLEQLELSESTHEVVWCDADGKHEYTLKPNWTAQQADLFKYRDQVQVRRFATMVD